MFVKMPPWLYSVFAAIAVLVAAANLALVGRIPQLARGTSGEAWLDFATTALMLAGFGSYMNKPAAAAGVVDQAAELAKKQASG